MLYKFSGVNQPEGREKGLSLQFRIENSLYTSIQTPGIPVETESLSGVYSYVQNSQNSIIHTIMVY